MGKTFKDKKNRITMEAYTIDGERGKFKNVENSSNRITKTAKEHTRNLNRLKKKAVRRESKLLIQTLIETNGETDNWSEDQTGIDQE